MLSVLGRCQALQKVTASVMNMLRSRSVYQTSLLVKGTSFSAPRQAQFRPCNEFLRFTSNPRSDSSFQSSSNALFPQTHQTECKSMIASGKEHLQMVVDSSANVRHQVPQTNGLSCAFPRSLALSFQVLVLQRASDEGSQRQVATARGLVMAKSAGKELSPRSNTFFFAANV